MQLVQPPVHSAQASSGWHMPLAQYSPRVQLAFEEHWWPVGSVTQAHC
jgi:hypothetical protein